jgi:hypothetical protein
MFRVRSKPTYFVNDHFRLFARSQSICSGLEDGFSEGLWNFLRQIVPAACDEPMLVLAGEFLRLSSGVWVWGAIRITLERGGRHRDDRKLGKPVFQSVRRAASGSSG